MALFKKRIFIFILLFIAGLITLLIIQTKTLPVECLQEYLSNQKIVSIGHSGMGNRSLIYSINSKKSIKKCFDSGSQGVEVDVQMTKDGELILYHDEHIKGTSNTQQRIIERNWLDDLENLKIGMSPLHKHKIPNLKWLLEDYKECKSCIISLDCKLYSALLKPTDNEYIEQFTRLLSSLLNSYEFKDQILIESNDTSFLNKMKTKNPELKTFINSSSIEDGLTAIGENNYTGITINFDRINREKIIKLHKSGIKVMLFNVNSRQKNKDAICMGPDYIQSDRIYHLVSILSKFQ